MPLTEDNKNTLNFIEKKITVEKTQLEDNSIGIQNQKQVLPILEGSIRSMSAVTRAIESIDGVSIEPLTSLKPLFSQVFNGINFSLQAVVVYQESLQTQVLSYYDILSDVVTSLKNEEGVLLDNQKINDITTALNDIKTRCNIKDENPQKEEVSKVEKNTNNENIVSRGLSRLRSFSFKKTEHNL